MVLYGLGGGLSLSRSLPFLTCTPQPPSMMGQAQACSTVMSWAVLGLGLSLLAILVAMSLITSPRLVRWYPPIMILFGALMLVIAGLLGSSPMLDTSSLMAALGGLMFASGVGITVWTNPLGNVRACPECGARVVVWSRKGVTYCTACEWYFGAIPESTSIMVIGDSGIGKSMLNLKLAELFLSRGKRCIFVVSNQPPASVKKTAMETHSLTRVAKALSENSDQFTFVDSLSSSGGSRSSERFYTKNTFDLDELGLLLDGLYKDDYEGGPVVIIDSVDPLFVHREASSVLRFLNHRKAKLLGEKGALIFSMTDGIVDETVSRRLESIADGIVEMRFVDGAEGRVRRFRLAKIRGENIFEDWVYFDVLPKEGMVFRPIERRGWQEFGIVSWLKGPRR